MKKRHFLNYGGEIAVNALVEQSREAAANLTRQGLRKSEESRVALIEGEEGPELIIYGFITPFAFWDDEVSSTQVLEQLREVKGKDLTVRINSPGGSVREGVAIFNLLKKHSGKVTTVVDGIAGSIASVIFMAGDKRQMGEGTQIFVHNAMSSVFGYAEDHRKEADTLEQISGQILNIYARRTNLSREELGEAMNGETYYTEAEALANGFTEEVIDLEEEPPEPEPAPIAKEPKPEPPKKPEPKPSPRNCGTVEDVARVQEETQRIAQRLGIDLEKSD